jgi:hypothetical protein
LWNGYRDCVDVDLKETEVEEIYGFPTDKPTWGRIDHCLFETVFNTFDVSEVVTDPQYCIDKCSSRGGGCFGVNVVPVMAPKTAYGKFKPAPGTTWTHPDIYGTDIYVPWNKTTFDSSRDKFLLNPAPEKYLCYSVQPHIFTDTQDEFTVSKDPHDPIFYSTCWYRFGGNTFADYVDAPPAPTDAVPWRYNTECIDCKSVAQYSDLRARHPIWNVTETCVNCDEEPSEAETPVVPDNIVVAEGTRCDGVASFPQGFMFRVTHNTCSNETRPNCTKQLWPIGRNLNSNVTLDECRAMVAKDKNCSNYYNYRVSPPYRCYCFTNQECCLNCSRKVDPLFVTYEMKTTADPTCATGVLSADGSFCCSASCTAGKCQATSEDTLLAVGFCSANSATRSCNQHGPPCVVETAKK